MPPIERCRDPLVGSSRPPIGRGSGGLSASRSLTRLALSVEPQGKAAEHRHHGNRGAIPGPHHDRADNCRRKPVPVRPREPASDSVQWPAGVGQAGQAARQTSCGQRVVVEPACRDPRPPARAWTPPWARSVFTDLQRRNAATRRACATGSLITTGCGLLRQPDKQEPPTTSRCRAGSKSPCRNGVLTCGGLPALCATPKKVPERAARGPRRPRLPVGSAHETWNGWPRDGKPSAGSRPRSCVILVLKLSGGSTSSRGA